MERPVEDNSLLGVIFLIGGSSTAISSLFILLVSVLKPRWLASVVQEYLLYQIMLVAGFGSIAYLLTRISHALLEGELKGTNQWSAVIWNWLDGVCVLIVVIVMTYWSLL